MHSSNEMYGADRILLQVLESIPQTRHGDITVLVPDDVTPAEHSLVAELESRSIASRVGPLPIVRRKYLTPRGLIGLLERMRQLDKTLRELSAEIVYVSTSAGLLAAPIARARTKAVIILHVQEIWAGGMGLLMGALSRYTHHVVAISEASRRSLKLVRSASVEVILNAVNDPISPRRQPGAANLRFLMASRWNSWKGHGTLLHAWKAANEPGELVIAGGPPELGTAVDVPKLVHDLGIESSVRIVGETSDLTGLIDEAHFVLMPSDEPEPFGLVSIEAFARGRAVIASRAGGLADIITDKETGRFFERMNADELATVLAELNATDAVEMGARARSQYESEYTPERFAERFQQLWTRVGMQ
ncbi:glycosyltransferase family 4 protein [Mycetocola lacteus]|uniref:glycosyltransferase family 4 protein n=1 Tax=Mycetocola lacteus TaxID=76637 RepID=UPI0015FF2076|nr:glycosyltransferase family 4 protein [Mycetocola lacteus]